jgi:hypothetical protein
MTSLSLLEHSEQFFHVRLGAATGEFGIEAGTLFLIHFFLAVRILGNWLVFIMMIMKSRVLYVAHR